MTQKRSPFDLIGKEQKRSFPIDRAISVDAEQRTVELSFASDQPIEHWFGFLILDHSPKAVNLKRLKQSGSLLLDHDWRVLVGVVEDASVDGGKSRAKVRFSRSALGAEVMQDVSDGIRRNVSVGFMVREMKLEKTEKGQPDTYRATRWEPFEISLVSVPADTSVGVGRSLELPLDRAADAAGCDCGIDGCECESADACDCEPAAETETSRALPGAASPQSEVRSMETEQTQNPAPAAAPPVNPEIARSADLIGFGRLFGPDAEALARTMALDGRNIDDLRMAIRAQQTAASPVVDPEPAASVARRAGGVELAQVSIPHRRMKNFANTVEGREAAYRSGQFVLAIIGDQRALEFCRSNGIRLSRTQSEGDNESGGYLVPNEFEAVLIDLREKYGVFRQYANVVPMGSNSKERPRRKGGLTAYPIGAVGTGRKITKSTKNWDRVGLNAKKWGVLAKYEEELSEDSVFNIADDLAGEIGYAMVKKEDECGFIGDGSSTYHGITGVATAIKALSGTIANIAGLQVASGNAWSEIVKADFLGLIGKLPEYADTPNARFFCSKTFWAQVMCNIVTSAGGVTAAEMENLRLKQFLGYEVVITQVMPKTEANSQVACLFGDLSKGVMFGDRRGVSVKMTDSNDDDFEDDLITIKGTERFDINVHDVGNASGTANLREPGPIVGLITAAS